MSSPPADARQVTHRRYVPASMAHYGGRLVDGAYLLSLFGDVATDLCIGNDGDEGLFASYSDVQFRAPVYAGDVVEASGVIQRVGHRSRAIDFEARVVSRLSDKDGSGSTATRLLDPIIVATARGVVVVPHVLDPPTQPGTKGALAEDAW